MNQSKIPMLTLIQAIPSIVLTALIGLIIKRVYDGFYTPELIYYKSQSASFPEQDYSYNIYTIVIENIGKKSAKNIKFILIIYQRMVLMLLLFQNGMYKIYHMI